MKIHGFRCSGKLHHLLIWVASVDRIKSIARKIDFSSARLWVHDPLPSSDSQSQMSDSRKRLAEWINTQPVDAVVVWNYSRSESQCQDKSPGDVLRTWVSSLSGDKAVITVISHEENSTTFADILSSARNKAIEAQELGASALLLMPPTGFGSDDQVWQKTFAYHQSILEAVQIPGVLVQESPSNQTLVYPMELADDLLTLPQILGIFLNTTDSLIRIQDFAGLLRLHPEKKLLSGMDRASAAALMAGATGLVSQTALAFPELFATLLKTYFANDYQRFVPVAKIADSLSQTISHDSISNTAARLRAWLAMDKTAESIHELFLNDLQGLESQELLKFSTVSQVLKKRYSQIGSLKTP